MNALEAELDYPFGETLPALGTTMEVAPGVYWVRMGLPFALNHINVWLLEDDIDPVSHQARGWTIIDCGITSDDTRDAWESVFATQLRGLPVIRVLVTHCHPDHVGLAHWLCDKWQAPLWMTTGEYAFARMMSAALPGVDGTSSAPHFQRHGLADPVHIEKLQGRNKYYPSMVPAMPQSYVRIEDQGIVRIGRCDWRVITGFGHSPEHAALYSADLHVLISGDMVLPRISTNVSVFAVEPESNPVQQFLDSLKKYSDLPEDTLVLPSHGKPFRGMHIRIGQLNDHHRDRLAEVLAMCVVPQTAMDILPVMFPRPLDTHQLGFALGEALAHLHQLWYAGVLHRMRGEDGVYRFEHVKTT